MDWHLDWHRHRHFDRHLDRHRHFDWHRHFDRHFDRHRHRHFDRHHHFDLASLGELLAPSPSHIHGMAYIALAKHDYFVTIPTTDTLNLKPL